MTHKEQLKDPRWQKKRLEIMSRDNFACRACYDFESTLNVHHTAYSGKYLWDALDCDMITLCEDCHGEWHRLFDNNHNPVRTYLVSRLKNQKQIEEMQLDIKIQRYLEKDKPVKKSFKKVPPLNSIKIPNLSEIKEKLKKENGEG